MRLQTFVHAYLLLVLECAGSYQRYEPLKLSQTNCCDHNTSKQAANKSTSKPISTRVAQPMATIKITIKNETTSFALETSPSESIAGVKARAVTLTPFLLLVYHTRLLTSAHVFLASVCL